MRRSLLVLAVAALSSASLAQLDQESFLTPPKAIADLVTAPRHLNVTLTNLSPDGSTFLISRSSGMPTMAMMAQPYFNLGGEMIDPVAMRDRSLNTRPLAGYDFYDWKTGKRWSVETPASAGVSGAEWSPSGKQIAFWVHFPETSRLFVADVTTGKSRQVGRAAGMTTLTAKIQWVDGGKSIFAVTVPGGKRTPPAEPAVPDQPVVRVADPKKNSLRNYASLLRDKHEAAMLEYYTTGQLARIDLSTGSVAEFGKPAMIRSFDASPDGKYARVTTTLKPFSYIVPASSFGQKEELWDDTGKVIAELSKRELTFEDTPAPTPNPTPGAGRGQGRGGAGRPDDKRNLAWRPDGAGLSFLQTEPAPERKEGEPAPEAPAARKDRVMLWKAPFSANDLTVVYETADRMSSVRYSADAKTLFISESKAGSENLYAIQLDNPGKRLNLYSRKTDDFYGNPGNLLGKPSPLGLDAVQITPRGTVLLSGTEFAKNPAETAPRPFLDEVEIASGKKTRRWQSAADVYENVATVLDADAAQLMLTRQSRSMIPASYVLDVASGGLKPTIANTDYAPDITQAPRYRVQITRADGLKFWANVVMPKWAAKGMKLPAFFWFYPSEFRDQKGYDEGLRTYNKNLFPAMGASTKDYLITQGYAVIEPDCPIIGTATAINDNYVSDLRMNLAATIDELEKQGFIDREKLAIGGHSYGAFSTVNAMIQTPYFKAGIAGDGNYNRTLTPFAFQSENRKLWEAKWTYLEMSPLLYAERITGALLMYHGLDDQNVGTDPINSPRLFGALEALGKPAALYMYPYEDHGPLARETHLDLWARWVAWLDKYVKGESKQ